MSKYVNKNGSFNHQKWQREQTLSAMKQPIDENVGIDFQKQIEFKAVDFMEEYLQHFEMLADEGKMPRNEFTKLEKMWTSAEKTLITMTNQLKKMSTKYLN